VDIRVERITFFVADLERATRDGNSIKLSASRSAG